MGVVVGRSDQLAVVDGASSAAAAGRGGLVLVTGEPGIGKTALASAASERAAARGMAVAQGYAVDDAGAPLLWPWHRVARRLPALDAVLADVAAPDPDDDALRFRLSDAVADALRGAAGPTGLLVVLEDLHWADSLTVAVLRHVALDLTSSRVLVLVTARKDPATSFGRVVPDLLRGGATSIPLRGLDADAVRGWLSTDRATAGWTRHADELVARTDGNPFFIRVLTTEPPPPSGTLDQVVRSRPGARDVLAAAFLQLPTGARDTVATAAVLGERLSPMLLAAATGRTVSAVSVDVAIGIRCGLLEHGPTGLSFVHALVRDAVLAHLLPPERAGLEASVAAAMDATGDEELAGPSAVHWHRAEGVEASRRCLERSRVAAAQAAAARAHEEAVGFTRLALEHARRLGVHGARLAELLAEQARSEWLANLVPAALASCVEAVDVAEAAGRPDLMARAALVPQGIGSLDVALVVDGLCERTLARLPEEALAERSGLLALRASAAAERALDTTADPLSLAALELARRSGSPEAELAAVAARHFTLCYPQAVHEREELARRAVELGPASTSAVGGLWGHLWQADIALQRGDLQTLHHTVERLGREAERRGSPVGRWHQHRLRALRAALLGSFDDARREAEAGRRLAERIGDLSMLGLYVAFRLQLALLRGDPQEIPDGALPLLESAPDIPLLQATLAQTYVLLGDRPRAQALLGTVRHVPDRMPLGPRWNGTVGQIGLAAAALGDAALAGRCRDMLLPAAGWCGADGGGTPWSHGSNHLPLGTLAWVADDVEQAARHFETAVDVDLRLGARPFVALARLGLARCLLRLGGQEPRARTLLVEAVAELEALDLPGPLALGRSVLATLPQGTASAPALSPRELEVARLVAEARSNQQIADQLVLSVRTVESHVRAALTKLDLTSRTELALWVRGVLDDGRPR
ncbi:AAA family ATPase [Terrabacter aeriphilus]|uniref:AAA family ATPase n=1 Tax=Terrabacter aeriphilus TaxID=515662 RepID=UPI0031EA8133